MKTTKWICCEGGAYRALVNTDGSLPENRVAFIEKTPRVRVRNMIRGYGGDFPDWLNWAERPYSGPGPDDEDSRRWCDAMLLMLGYELG
jgi:hypothetical protein